MNREHEQFAASISTSESVVNYLVNTKNLTIDQVKKIIMDSEPTKEMIDELWENAISDDDYFFWGDVEYCRNTYTE